MNSVNKKYINQYNNYKKHFNGVNHAQETFQLPRYQGTRRHHRDGWFWYHR